jgi:hypothetical protein
VGIVNEVEYFDDSKGTNVGATVAALQGLGAERRLVIILGGDGKGQDFAPLAEPVARFARAAVLIGRDGPRIRAVLEPTGVPLADAATMQEAVRLATQRALCRRRRADVAGLRQFRHVPQLSAPRRGVPRGGAGAGGRNGRHAGRGRGLNFSLPNVFAGWLRNPFGRPADAAWMPGQARDDLRIHAFDPGLLWVAVALLAWGLVMVYSASIALPDSPKFSRYAHTYF